jgi:hypothetical protein
MIHPFGQNRAIQPWRLPQPITAPASPACAKSARSARTSAASRGL